MRQRVSRGEVLAPSQGQLGARHGNLARRADPDRDPARAQLGNVDFHVVADPDGLAAVSADQEHTASGMSANGCACEYRRVGEIAWTASRLRVLIRMGAKRLAEMP